jgi:hypothetical protein
LILRAIKNSIENPNADSEIAYWDYDSELDDAI